jgi:hypothetical protein
MCLAKCMQQHVMCLVKCMHLPSRIGCVDVHAVFSDPPNTH